MTLPIERTRTVLRTEIFLIDLANGSYKRDEMKAIRRIARYLLRHYPTSLEMNMTARKCPEYWALDKVT